MLRCRSCLGYCGALSRAGLLGWRWHAEWAGKQTARCSRAKKRIAAVIGRCPARPDKLASPPARKGAVGAQECALLCSSLERFTYRHTLIGTLTILTTCWSR